MRTAKNNLLLMRNSFDCHTISNQHLIGTHYWADFINCLLKNRLITIDVDSTFMTDPLQH